jgi:hypothetical protein
LKSALFGISLEFVALLQKGGMRGEIGYFNRFADLTLFLWEIKRQVR